MRMDTTMSKDGGTRCSLDAGTLRGYAWRMITFLMFLALYAVAFPLTLVFSLALVRAGHNEDVMMGRSE